MIMKNIAMNAAEAGQFATEWIKVNGPDAMDGFVFDADKLIVPDDQEVDALAMFAALPDIDLIVDARENAKAVIRTTIDAMRRDLLAKYTETEQAGWHELLPEANAYTASGNEGNAPGIALEAAIRGVTVADRAAEILAAAEITAMLPPLASGVRGRAGAMIDAAADEAEINAILTLLAGKSTATMAAIAAGDKAAVLAVVTTGWN